VTTSVGIDVATQTGSTTNIGVRIAKASTYTLQLTDTGGTSAGGITFSTDTALWRSAAGVIKVESILDAETGFRVAGAAAAGKYLRGDGTNFVSSALKGGDLEEGSVKASSLAFFFKENVYLATTEALAGEPEVVGETLLSKAEEKLKVDNAEPEVGKRILVKNQAEAKTDGIYKVIKAGKAGEKWELKRTNDANTTTELQDASVIVETGGAGSVQTGSIWMQIASVNTVGTTNQKWEPFINKIATLGSEVVTEGKIGAKAVTAGKLGEEAVTAQKLKAEAVEAAAIKKETITGVKIANTTITSTKVVLPTKPAAGAENTVVVGTAGVPRQIVAVISGNAVATAFKIKHSLETQIAAVNILSATFEEPVTMLAKSVAISLSEIEVTFTVAPGKGVLNYVVITG
jgi:hypothetical protein